MIRKLEDKYTDNSFCCSVSHSAYNSLNDTFSVFVWESGHIISIPVCNSVWGSVEQSIEREARK